MTPIEEAISCLEQHISKIATVNEWAEKMNYRSTSYFSRKIRAFYKQSPHSIIVDKKLLKIKKQLVNSPDQLFTIALENGFTDNNSFYKFIKLHTGLSPSDLRKEMIKKEIEIGD